MTVHLHHESFPPAAGFKPMISQKSILSRDSVSAVTIPILGAAADSIVPCFTPDTGIATPKGRVPVQDLRVGDRVITRDNGFQEIRWVGTHAMQRTALQARPRLRPIRIQGGALGRGLPERDILVSPEHRVLVSNNQTTLLFKEREVLVAAKDLTHCDGIDIAGAHSTIYTHVMFDRHEVILSDGAWTESFQPNDMSLGGIGAAQRDEIFSLFPELRKRSDVETFPTARRALKHDEARLIAR